MSQDKAHVLVFNAKSFVCRRTMKLTLANKRVSSLNCEMKPTDSSSKPESDTRFGAQGIAHFTPIMFSCLPILIWIRFYEITQESDATSLIDLEQGKNTQTNLSVILVEDKILRLEHKHLCKEKLKTLNSTPPWAWWQIQIEAPWKPDSIFIDIPYLPTLRHDRCIKQPIQRVRTTP